MGTEVWKMIAVKHQCYHRPLLRSGCPLALHAPNPSALSISSPSQGVAVAQPKPLAGGVQGPWDSLPH